MLLDSNLIMQWLRKQTAEDQIAAFVDAARSTGISISAVTAHELRRGVAVLNLRGEGRKQQVRLEKLLDTVTIFELEGGIWSLADEYWAKAITHKPSITITDADLLIACTAAFHDQLFVTAEGRLIENLRAIEFPCEMLALPA